MHKNLLVFILAASLLFIARPAAAQSPGPVYVVQPGDTLSSIAARFNVSIDDLMAANGMSNPNLLAVGQQLVIPGLEGVTGILDTELINFGDSFRTLMRRTQVSSSLLRRLNHLVSPTEFYVGASMIIPKQEQSTDLTNRFTPAPGESLLELALKQNSDVWTLTQLNSLNGTWDALPGDVLYAMGSASEQSASGLPSAFVSARVAGLPLKQGGTAEIIIQPANGVTLGGVLVDKPLHFFPMGNGSMVALQGIHAMLDPGVYPLRLDAVLPDGSKQSFEQMILVASGNYAREALSVPSEYIDPAITGPEDQQVLSIVAPVTPTKYWQNLFALPVGLPYCIKDWFGLRRSFNGSAYNYFHSGVDYGICSQDHPFDIYVAADGVVVFASALNVRGNATIIDHGWGVYTAYYHQAEIYVSAGQQVKAGELIGKIGQTGRVTGPHLHWEVWVNGVQVNPLDWLGNPYP